MVGVTGVESSNVAGKRGQSVPLGNCMCMGVCPVAVMMCW